MICTFQNSKPIGKINTVSTSRTEKFLCHAPFENINDMKNSEENEPIN